MSLTLRNDASRALASAFSAHPEILGYAPGRVELLGNHTDYNGGLVMSAAIDRHTAVVGRRVGVRQASAYTADLDQSDTFALDDIPRGEPGMWVRYVRGVVWAMQERFGPLDAGFEIALAGDVPIGAGLSSSASVQAAVALFLMRIGMRNSPSADDLDDALRMDLAHVLRRSENEFVGVGSGLLDQFSVLFGKANGAMVLDCRTLDYERVPLGSPAPAIVVCDSRTSRKLADGKYNERRDECDRVVAYFQALEPDRGITQLRDLTMDDLQSEWERLHPVARLRARHVLTENDRVRQGALALKSGHVSTFGRLMTASHESSRSDFQNSSTELDWLIEVAQTAPGFLGGKLSGAGWAGCTVNLVEADRAGDFTEFVKAGFARLAGAEPVVHVCHAADGASSS